MGRTSAPRQPVVVETTESATKKIGDGTKATVEACATAVATVSYGEAATAPRARRVRLKGMEYVYLGIMAAALLAVVLAVGLVVSNRKETIVVYLPRETHAPSESPTESYDEDYTLLLDLPEYTTQAIAGGSRYNKSPQSLAYDWTRDHPEFRQMPPWRKKQVFAMATVCFAFTDRKYLARGEGNWLDSSKSECLWLPGSSQGACNDHGQIQALTLDEGIPQAPSEEYVLENGFLKEAPQSHYAMPPEIALLMGLRSIRLSSNPGLAGKLEQLLPWSQLAELSSLNQLVLESNHLSGSIPTEVGLLPDTLEILSFRQNALTGPVPSQLGLLTSLQILDLSSNFVTGTIPPEVLDLRRWHDLNESITWNNGLT